MFVDRDEPEHTLGAPDLPMSITKRQTMPRLLAGYSAAWSTWIRPSVLSVVVAACESDASTEGGSSGLEVGSELSTSMSGGDELPADCSAEESPFLREACLDALSTRCREYDAENSCVAANPLSFDNDGYVVRCRWAKVVTFSESSGSSCDVVTTAGRCEATVDTPCSDGCAGDFFLTDLKAFPMLREIVQVCGGPLGAWAAVGVEAGGGYVGCAPDTIPPAPPLCECATVACEAQ